MCYFVLVRAFDRQTNQVEVKTFEKTECAKKKAGLTCKYTNDTFNMETTSWDDITSGKVLVGTKVYPTPTVAKTPFPLPKLKTTTPPPPSPTINNIRSPKSPPVRRATTASPLAFGLRLPPTPKSQRSGTTAENSKSPATPASAKAESQPYIYVPTATKEKKNAKDAFVRPSHTFDIGGSPTFGDEPSKPSQARDPRFRFQEDLGDDSADEDPAADLYRNYNASDSQNSKYKTSYTSTLSQSSTQAHDSFNYDDYPIQTKDWQAERADARERARKSSSKSVEPDTRTQPRAPSPEDKKRRRKVRRRRNVSHETNDFVNGENSTVKAASVNVEFTSKGKETTQYRKNSPTFYTDDDESLKRPKKTRARNL